MNTSPSARDRERLAAEQAAARRKERRTLVIVVLAVVLAVVGGGIAVQAWRTGRAPVAAGPVTPAPGGPGAPVVDGKPIVLGGGGPPTVALFEDFHCPHCADFTDEFGPVLEQALAAGQARIELYPMAFIDEGSAAASNALACATEAGFGPAYYQGLFANHTLRWSDAQLIDLAGKAGGSATPAFSRCVTERTHAGWVTSINTAADQQGVTGTPTMLVDGKPVDIATLTPDRLHTLLTEAG